jgi:hypothetical protein
MADTASRQWLNVADDTVNKRALDEFHEKVLKGIPVIAERSETRLFRLLPDEEDAPLAGQLVWAHLDRQPVFEALSYTWGKSPERTHITLNTIPGFPITTNLAGALRRLRLRDRPRQLWIDAMSIDQTNDDERARQLSLMSRIFGSAQTVVVWLGEAPALGQRLYLEAGEVDFQGDGFPELKRGLFLPKGSSSRKKSCLQDERKIGYLQSEEQWHQDSDSDLRALRSVVLNPEPRWWDRAWIRQEFALSKNVPMVYFGPCQYSYERFQSLLWVLEANGEESVKDVGLLYIMSKLIDSRRTMAHQTHGVADVAAQLNRAQAADPRDKIYSILSLSKPEEAAMIQPDYKRGTAETFAKTTYDLISKTSSFSTMAYVSLERPRPRSLPTWTVDFSFAGLDKSARDRLHRRSFFSESGYAYNHYVDSHSDDELLDSDELERILMRTRKGPATQPRVSLSRDEMRMTAGGFIIDAVETVVPLSRPTPGKTDNSLAVSLTTVLDGLPVHPFAGWDRTKPRIVVDQVGMSQARAPPESACDWKRMLANVQRVDLGTDEGFPLDSGLLTEYQYQDDVLDEAFRGWRTYFGLPTSAARLGVGWAGSVRRHWQTNREFELGDRAEGTVFFTTAKGFIGVGLTNMAAGDHVVLLHGCNDVMLLRQRSGEYEYQGTVYVHGVSDGELDDLFDEGAFAEEDFCLV